MRSFQRSGGFAILVAAATIALAGCEGGSSSPHVASLPTSTSLGVGADAGRGSSTATTAPKGDPIRLLNEWAACMRSHGDPNQADPTIDANKDIDINWNPATTGGIFGTFKGGQGNSGPGQYCRSYLTPAQLALSGAQQQVVPDQAMLMKYAECMRANGIADFPDPANGGLTFSAGGNSDLDPANPTFQKASKFCAQKTGVHFPGTGGTPPPGVIRIDGAGPPGN
jgi:hypothetical protein